MHRVPSTQPTRVTVVAARAHLDFQDKINETLVGLEADHCYVHAIQITQSEDKEAIHYTATIWHEMN